MKLLCLFLGLSLTAAASGRPNFLLLVTDDQRWDTVSVNDPKVALATPHMDRLAKEGVNFENGFVTTPICAVSRACILSGRYSRNNGIHEFLIPMTDAVFASSYPAQLKKAGYHIGQLGKYGVGATRAQIASFDVFHADCNQGPPFHDYRGKKVHDSEWLTLETRDFLDNIPKDKPFCLQVNYKAPHASSVVAEEDKGKLAHHTFDPLSAQVVEGFAKLPPSARKGFGHHVFLEEMGTEADYQRYRRTYLEKIASADRSIGEIRKLLERYGYDQNTIIVFISDHGTHYGEKKLGGKWTPYDQSLRVPFFLYDPRPNALKNVRLPQIALNIDIAPTLLDLAGLEVPPAMDGRSLAPLVRGAKPAWREHFFYEHQTSPVGVARPIARFMGVRNLAENYVRWTDEKPVVEEYYDLPNDSWEINNLINNPEKLGKIARLRGLFTEWEKQNPNTYAYHPYGPRPQTHARDIDWQRYRKAWPQAYEKIAAEVKRLGVSWDDALNNPETREAIGKATGWYY
nr:sulfatase-like hydrolase/transferase [Akkermansiaceae bacterium]